MKSQSTLTFVLSQLEKNIGKSKLLLMFFSIFFISIYLTLQPLFFGRIVEELELFYSTWSFALDTLILITAFWFWYSVLWTLLRYYIWQEIITRPLLVDYKENIKVYSKWTLNMSLCEYLSKKIWSIYKLIDRWTENTLFFFFSFFELYFYYIVQIITVVVVLFFIDIRMAFISLSLLPLMLWLWYYFVTVTSPRQNQLSARWEKIFDIVWNAMSNFSLFKTLWLQSNFFGQIDTITEKTYHEQMNLNKYWNISEIYGAVIVMLTRIIVLWSWIYFIIDGSLTLAQLFVIFAYVDWIYFPLWAISRELRTSVKQLTEIKRLRNTLWSLEEESENSWKTVGHISWNIEFQDVSFAYTPENPILKDISFSIKKWETLALVGHTGSGKSTIVNLLLRFWEVSSGSILLDGQDIRELQKRSLRWAVGVVSQDNSLFNLSIRENLMFAKEDASEEELREALKNAQADFVFTLPQGLDTIIGERGLKLSGWEKQRISIARLFLKNPEILVLDEATSALDTATEKKIDRALKKLMKGKTSIIIAHRLSTIRHADTICVLENGQVVETGSYEKLLNLWWKFSELVNPDALILW